MNEFPHAKLDLAGSPAVRASRRLDIDSHQLGWRMAVLPFRSVGSPLGHGLGLGMAEEVSAALCRFRAPRLIATATFWDGAQPVSNALAQCRAYGLDYVVDGTMQVVGKDARVNVTLLDVVLDFEVVWSNQFDGHLDDLFSLQHRIASETVAQVDPELLKRGTIHQPSVPTEIAAAHHSVLAAIQAISRPDRPNFMQARELLEDAIKLDPDYAAPHAWLAYWCILAAGHGWVEHPRNVTAMAGIAAERAVSLDPLDARALAIAGHVKAYLFHDVKTALLLHARATELNPNLPLAWALSSCSKVYNAEHETAIHHASFAVSLSPRDPFLFFTEHLLVIARLFSRQLEEAEMLSDSVLTRHPRHASAIHMRLAISGHLGHREDAAHWLNILQEIDPGVSVEKLRSRIPLRPDDTAFYVDGLRRAGVPERSASELAAD